MLSPSSPFHRVLLVLLVLLVLAGVLPASTALASEVQEFGCDDMPSRDAAQTVSETDPILWASALDPDGNGQACEHRTALHDQDVAAYLEEVVDQVTALDAGLAPLLEIVQATDRTAVGTRDRVEADGIVERFARAPDVAASLERGHGRTADHAASSCSRPGPTIHKTVHPHLW